METKAKPEEKKQSEPAQTAQTDDRDSKEETKSSVKIEKEASKEEKAEKEKKKEEKKSEEKLKKLQEENKKLNEELTETQDVYKRMLAEYANYKRRTEKEKEQLGDFTKAETLKALLPALDNLERAVEAPPGDEYKKGIDMTVRQLEELLTALGLEAIDAKGATFDPEIHHAVMREDADGVEPDTVTEIFQKGYKLGGRVLRPAMVKVAN